MYRADPKVREAQSARLREVRTTRDNGRVRAALAGLRQAAQGTSNIFPTLFAACESRATIGEMISTLKQVFGEYQEPKTV
jgi:methylmalonyl-CoA mutase N-terminal domain/subunit